MRRCVARTFSPSNWHFCPIPELLSLRLWRCLLSGPTALRDAVPKLDRMCEDRVDERPSQVDEGGEGEEGLACD